MKRMLFFFLLLSCLGLLLRLCFTLAFFWLNIPFSIFSLCLNISSLPFFFLLNLTHHVDQNLNFTSSKKCFSTIKPCPSLFYVLIFLCVFFLSAYILAILKSTNLHPPLFAYHKTLGLFWFTNSWGLITVFNTYWDWSKHYLNKWINTWMYK